MRTLLVSIVCLASSVLADDFKTIDGKEYKNVKVKRVEPDGIVLTTPSEIWKLYFNELPKEVQQSFHYDAAKAAAFSGQQASTQEAFRQQQEAAQRQRQEATVTSPRKPDPTPSATESIATSGIETLSPITVQLKDELLSALKMTDELDALYKRGCSSAEFITAALPVERVVMKLQKKLPKADPRHDLLVNTFEAYQNAAVAMKANEQGRGERPSSVIAAAQVRKHLLTKILQGNMTPEEKKVYYAWRNALTNP